MKYLYDFKEKEEVLNLLYTFLIPSFTNRFGKPFLYLRPLTSRMIRMI